MKRSGNIKKETLIRLLSYLKRSIPTLLVTLVLSAGSVIFSLYIPVLCGRAVDAMGGVGSVDFEALCGVLVRLAVAAALSAVLQWGTDLLSYRIAYSVKRDVRRDAFGKMVRLPLRYMDARPHGETVSRMIGDVDALADGLLLGFTRLFSGILTIVCTFVFMAVIHPVIALAVAVLTPLSVLTASMIGRRTFRLFQKQATERASVTAKIEEDVEASALIRAYSHEAQSFADFAVAAGRMEKASLRAVFISSLINPATRFVNNLVYAAVCLTGALTVVSGGMTVGGLTSFLAYANRFTRPFNEISEVIAELQHAVACAGRIFELIDEQSETPDGQDAVVLSGVAGKVDLEDVRFSYDPAKPLIEGMDLSFEPGQRIALVGPTGCGKTTLINLLMRFYDVDGGSIRIDGNDIRNVTRDSLRSSFGMVLQDTWIMNGTVRDNILMGREATDDEVIAAAVAAHADPFIRRLSDGYNTVLTDGGVLSHGQRQLLCIARIMLRLPAMLILDEATSSIDTRTEMMIQNGFAAMMRGRTSFIVAHRLSTIREADVILVMCDGRIVETGTHEELLRLGGFYYSLWNS